MIFLLALFFVFNHSHEKLIYDPTINFEIAAHYCTIKEHIINAQNPANSKLYKDYLDFFIWDTPQSTKNHALKRFIDRRTNNGVVSKYIEAYKQGFNLIEKNKFSVIQFESDEASVVKTFVILNFSSNDSAHVNHLMDFLNVHRSN